MEKLRHSPPDKQYLGPFNILSLYLKYEARYSCSKNESEKIGF